MIKLPGGDAYTYIKLTNGAKVWYDHQDDTMWECIPVTPETFAEFCKEFPGVIEVKGE
jgi:hypothetical protein